MRILMAGASGFLGTRLIERLRAHGHEITRLVRRPAQAADEIPWQPSAGQLDPAPVAAADAVINLAGAGVGAKRWTPSYKSQIRSSRVDSTGTIARVIKNLPAEDRPTVLINASAEGWYGDTGDRAVTEEAPAGNTFLADVCRVWEAAARPAEDAGVRVALLRTGLVLDRQGDLMKPQMLPFKLGLGARIGTGRQWWSCIAVSDWLDAAEFVLDRDDIAGPVNLVGPEPVTNAQFTAAFGRALHRPAVLFIPPIALRAALGEFADETLRSQRVLPGVLTRAGFTWAHPTVDSALRAAVGADATASA
jgi:uncharacterized protein